MREGVKEGIVFEKKSRIHYIVKLLDVEEVNVYLSLNYVLHNMELKVGSKVFVGVFPKTSRNYILTASDFKLNGWSGWTDEHEPKN